MYNRFDKDNNTKNGFDHSLIFSSNNNTIPIWIILNMTEEEYYLKDMGYFKHDRRRILSQI